MPLFDATANALRTAYNAYPQLEEERYVEDIPFDTAAIAQKAKTDAPAVSSVSLFDKYLKELDNTTRIGNMVDVGLAAANLPFLLQKRQQYPRISTPKVHAPQMRNDTALFRSMAKEALGVADLSNRKYLNEAGRPSLYSTANMNEALAGIDKSAYERNREIATANANLASQADAANVNTAIQADAAQREGQFKIDEITRNNRMQSLANILGYGSSIARRVTGKTNALMNAEYAKQYQEESLWAGYNYLPTYGSGGTTTQKYDINGNPI